MDITICQIICYNKVRWKDRANFSERGNWKKKIQLFSNISLQLLFFHTVYMCLFSNILVNVVVVNWAHNMYV